MKTQECKAKFKRNIQKQRPNMKKNSFSICLINEKCMYFPYNYSRSAKNIYSSIYMSTLKDFSKQNSKTPSRTVLEFLLGFLHSKGLKK